MSVLRSDKKGYETFAFRSLVFGSLLVPAGRVGMTIVGMKGGGPGTRFPDGRFVCGGGQHG